MTKLRPPFTGLNQNEIFAIEATTAQLVVRPADSSSDRVEVRLGDRLITIPVHDGVGVGRIDGLTPNQPFHLQILGGGGEVVEELSGTTRPILAGATKVATISDVHLGTTCFGPSKKIADTGTTPYPLRCGRAAIDEALEWGAEALVIKGDLTDTGAKHEWEMVATMLDGVEIPVMITAGNHDVWSTREVMPTEGAASIGRLVEPVQVLEIGMVRIVLVDTSIPSRGSGDLARHRDRVVEAVTADMPVLLCIHHNIERLPAPWFWPSGIKASNAMPVVEELRERNPLMMITSGHSHRNRRHRLLGGDVIFTEVSATCDYPGVWAGYEITPDTIRQTVHRIASAEATSWTEATRAALRTVWPRWSQGRLDDRCLDVFARR